MGDLKTCVNTVTVHTPPCRSTSNPRRATVAALHYWATILKVIREMLGENYHRVLTSDRWTAYTWLKRRQLCWAHLRRDFQAMTAWQQNRNVLELLTACCTARLAGSTAPSLLPTAAARAAA